MRVCKKGYKGVPGATQYHFLDGFRWPQNMHPFVAILAAENRAVAQQNDGPLPGGNRQWRPRSGASSQQRATDQKEQHATRIPPSIYLRLYLHGFLLLAGNGLRSAETKHHMRLQYVAILTTPECRSILHDPRPCVKISYNRSRVVRRCRASPRSGRKIHSHGRQPVVWAYK